MIVPIDLQPPRCETCRYLSAGYCRWGPMAILVECPSTHWCGQWEPRQITQEVSEDDDCEV